MIKNMSVNMSQKSTLGSRIVKLASKYRVQLKVAQNSVEQNNRRLSSRLY